MQAAKRNVLVTSASVLLLLGCYHLLSVATVLSAAPTWTGAGHASVSTSTHGYAVGLAGEDIYVFRGSSRSLFDSPLLGLLGAGYTLTGIAQTHNLGHHENTFLHAYPAGNRGALDLFLTLGFHFGGTDRVVAASPGFVKGGVAYQLTRICDLAAAPLPAFGHPSDDDSHLFLSGIACRNDNPSSCVGAIVEADFSLNTSQWWVKSFGGVQAAIHRRNGVPFVAECMPISATGLGGTGTHYLAVGAPADDELTLFRVGALDEPAVSSRSMPHASQNIADLVIEGRRDGTTDFSFLTVLWSGAGGNTLEHTTAVNGALPTSAFLAEALHAGVRFIHTDGAGGKPPGDQADVFTFGNSVERRTYVRD